MPFLIPPHLKSDKIQSVKLLEYKFKKIIKAQTQLSVTKIIIIQPKINLHHFSFQSYTESKNAWEKQKGLIF